METTNNSYSDIKCPICSEKNKYEAESVPWNDDEEREVECHYCEGTFILRQSISYWWFAEEKD